MNLLFCNHITRGLWKYNGGKKERRNRVQCRNQTEASSYLITVNPEPKQQEISYELPLITFLKPNNTAAPSVLLSVSFFPEEAVGEAGCSQMHHANHAYDIRISSHAAVSTGPSQPNGSHSMLCIWWKFKVNKTAAQRREVCHICQNINVCYVPLLTENIS